MDSPFVVRAARSHAGLAGRDNEDAWGHIPNAAWVIDGATGVEADRICPGRTDAAWFASTMSAQLAAVWRDDVRTLATMETALLEVKRSAAMLGDQWPGGYIGPTASIAIARAIHDQLEIAVLGDCRVIEVKFDGTVAAHGASRIYQLDQELLREVYDVRESQLSDKEKAVQIAKLEFDLRSRANRDDGYFILDLAGRGLRSTQLIRLAAAPVAALILVTDGIYRLVDTYLEHDDVSFARSIMGADLDTIFQRLRSIEEGDPHCRRFKRIKPSDDATLLVFGRREALTGAHQISDWESTI